MTMQPTLPTQPAAKLSIIVPVLNEAQCIVDTLNRLQALRERGAEIIVVDGGSSDSTHELARTLADHVMQTAPGRARQMNAGAACARAEVLLFLHADTLLPERADQLVLDALAASPQAWGRFDVFIAGHARMLKLIAALMNLRSRLTGIATGDQAIFARRMDFLAVGGFPEQPLMEDIEISKRLKARTAPLCLRQKVITSGRRWEKHGVWRTIFLMWRLRLLYWLGTSSEKLAKSYR